MHWWTLWKVLGEEVKVSRLFPIITTRDIHKGCSQLGGKEGASSNAEKRGQGEGGV